MLKVSVIMPCLNMAEYIEACLDSVVCQTLKEIEILVIDAGSTDGTIEILDKYAREDSRIHIIHSEKKSYGYQMNLGVSMSNGEYIGIVETDDMIQPDMFEVLYAKASSCRADYVKGTSETFFRGTNGMEWRSPVIPSRDLQSKPECVIVPKNTPKVFLDDNFLWNGIYRREFIQKIRFHETPGAAFQDIGVLFQIASTASTGIYIKHMVYHYRQDNLGASSYNKKGLSYMAVEYGYIKQFLQGLSVEWEKVYYLKMAGLCTDRFHVMAASGEFWEDTCAIEELRARLQYAVDYGLICQENCQAWQKQLWKELCIFLDNPRALYEYNREKYEQKLGTVRKLAEEAGKKNIYIFGAGRLGQFIYLLLALQKMNVVGYCDNNKDIQGKDFQEIKVLSPEEAVKNDSQAYYVIASARHNQTMKNQLIQLGVKEELIGIYNLAIDKRLLGEYS